MRAALIYGFVIVLLGGCGRAEGPGATPAPSLPTPVATAPATATSVPPSASPLPTDVPATTQPATPEPTPPSTTAPRPSRPTQTPEILPAPTDPLVVPPLPSGNPLPDPLPAALEQQVQAARADLAQRTGADISAVEVVAALAVVWPDGSLGCPKPGMIYPQVQIDGVLVQLRTGGQVFSYHGDGQRELSLCGPSKG